MDGPTIFFCLLLNIVYAFCVHMFVALWLGRLTQNACYLYRFNSLCRYCDHRFFERIECAWWWPSTSLRLPSHCQSQNNYWLRIRHDDMKLKSRQKYEEKYEEYSKNNNNNINAEQESKTYKTKIVHVLCAHTHTHKPLSTLSFLCFLLDEIEREWMQCQYFLPLNSSYAFFCIAFFTLWTL